MWEWLQRRNKRYSDLANGVDADLVRANQRRRNTGLALLGLWLVLVWVFSRLQLQGNFRTIGTSIIIALFLVAVFLLKWAGQESAFLSKPDPKEPPSILKGK